MNLNEFQRISEFLICIDSDGCVFDTMELKHKECFIPTFIKHYGLQGVSKYARQAAEFVNLYSRSRGANRFPALIEQLDWLRSRAEVVELGVDIPDPKGLRQWVASESRLSNPSLQRAIERSGDADLRQALDWSLKVNVAIAAMVRSVPPFPRVVACLQRMAKEADLFVVSATPNEALHAEWEEHDLAKFVRSILGQEWGTKKELLTLASRYPEGHALMIGDAPGDHAAAVANGCLFFPINSGQEIRSWERLFEEGIERFFAGVFESEYQRELLREFDAYLPAAPPWQSVQAIGAA